MAKLARHSGNPSNGKDSDELSLRLGELVHRLRTQMGLSIRALATKAELSNGLICELEQGRVKPTVRTLLKLSDALDLRPDLFLGAVAGGGTPDPAGLAAPDQVEHGDRWRVQRSDKRTRMTLPNGLGWEGLLPGVTPGCSLVQLTLPPGGMADEQVLTHEGSEFGLVLSGQLTVELGTEQHQLEAGDCVYFDSSMPHRLKNPGPDELRVLWVNFGGHATTAPADAFPASGNE